MQGYIFDIDGTLYNDAFHEVSQKTMEALHDLQTQGSMVMAATSRATQEWEHLPSALRKFPFDVRICDGGSLIYDQNGRILQQHPMDKNIVYWISYYCEKHNMCWKYSTKTHTHWGSKYVNAPMYQVCWRWYMSMPSYKPYQGQPVYNMIVYFDDEGQDKEVSQFVQHLSVIRYYDCIEIRQDHCDKSDAIHYLRNTFSLDTITCFGDGDNDVDMLKAADIGVAMGNGRPNTKKQADIVIGRVDEDGIYRYLKEKSK